jgi:hypothetical protein
MSAGDIGLAPLCYLGLNAQGFPLHVLHTGCVTATDPYLCKTCFTLVPVFAAYTACVFMCVNALQQTQGLPQSTPSICSRNTGHDFSNK